MYRMFYYARRFNQDISGWDVGSVTGMSYAFYMATDFNQDLGWCVDYDVVLFNAFIDTRCESTSCGVHQLSFCTAAPTPVPTPHFDGVHTDTSIREAVAAWLSNPDAAEARYGHISRWKTGGVSDMGNLFSRADRFSDDISAWDTSGVTTMYAMFYYASSFNQDISGWSIEAVTSMNDMFRGASDFDQDLGWCLSDDVTLASPFEKTKCESTSCGVSYKDGLGLCEPWARPCLIYAGKQCIINSPTLIIFIIILVLFAGFGAYVHRRKEEDETYFAAACRLVISSSHSVRDRLTALAYALRNKMEPSNVNSRPDSPAESPRDEPDEEATDEEATAEKTEVEETVEPSSFSKKFTSFFFGEQEETPMEEAPKEEEEAATLPVFAEAEEEATEQPPPPPARRWFSSAEPEPTEPKAEEMHQRMAGWYNNAPEAAALRATWGAFPEPGEFQTWPGFVAVTNAFLDREAGEPEA
jgi:surface protein